LGIYSVPMYNETGFEMLITAKAQEARKGTEEAQLKQCVFFSFA